ncbi:hypothetical protein FEM55_04685 [Dyadobacter sediminis]|uniref:Uncharacterized protein n=1 Tax=Dyadobacter sediminis TaxID=1493691 RepID=A0A5R9KJQ3_9BACT|nr:hypothetical protein FEM55_04685 [Dyadobacter sediminis]
MEKAFHIHGPGGASFQSLISGCPSWATLINLFVYHLLQTGWPSGPMFAFAAERLPVSGNGKVISHSWPRRGLLSVANCRKLLPSTSCY